MFMFSFLAKHLLPRDQQVTNLGYKYFLNFKVIRNLSIIIFAAGYSSFLITSFLNSQYIDNTSLFSMLFVLPIIAFIPCILLAVQILLLIHLLMLPLFMHFKMVISRNQNVELLRTEYVFCQNLMLRRLKLQLRSDQFETFRKILPSFEGSINDLIIITKKG